MTPVNPGGPKKKQSWGETDTVLWELQMAPKRDPKKAPKSIPRQKNGLRKELRNRIGFLMASGAVPGPVYVPQVL